MRVTLVAEDDVRQLLTPGEADRLLRLAIEAAVASPGWRQGEEFCYEIEDDRCLIDGFERSVFVVRHEGSRYEVTLYDGLASQFVQCGERDL